MVYRTGVYAPCDRVEADLTGALFCPAAFVQQGEAQVPVLAEATDGTWQIELVETAPAGPWEFKLRNLRRFDEVFGRPVLSAFCRCFVHVDRLNSLISCMHTSEQFHGRDSVAYARDLNTLVWFTVGTLRELALAIQGLRTTLATRGRLDAESAPWVALRDLERRWENNADYRRMRNQAAFHVDPEVIERGLNVLVEDEDDVTLAEGRGARHVDSRLTLGMLSLHNGLELDLEGYGQFLEAVMEGHMAAGKDIQDAFVLAARAIT